MAVKRHRYKIEFWEYNYEIVINIHCLILFKLYTLDK